MLLGPKKATTTVFGVTTTTTVVKPGKCVLLQKRSMSETGMSNEVKILELLARYNIEATKTGENYVAFCSFHEDVNRPNFTVYPKTDSWFCFTCSKGGDAIDFFAQMEGITRKQASQRLYDDLQILVEKLNEEKKEKPYNDVVDLHISKKIREFLYIYPDKLPAVKKLMKAIDEHLTKDVDQAQALDLIIKVTSRLAILKG